MPKWRGKQRALSVEKKVELLGRFIQETRQLELVKKQALGLRAFQIHES